MTTIDEGKQIIKECVQKGVSKKVVDFADRFGKRLACDLGKDKLTTSQIRNIFGDVKKLEMKGYNESEFLLLMPKLAYAAKRGTRGTVKLKDILTEGINAVVQGNDENEKKKRFDNFCKFFEAVLAYHRAYGGA